jgi:hypothetical protein
MLRIVHFWPNSASPYYVMEQSQLVKHEIVSQAQSPHDLDCLYMLALFFKNFTELIKRHVAFFSPSKIYLTDTVPSSFAWD